MTVHEESGSPYTPHTDEEMTAMLEEIGASDESDLFDIPEGIVFDGNFGIDQRSEQAVREEIESMMEKNESLTEFLGRGHYDHYQPAIVDDLAGRSEFLTSYTQYQPEVAQGFLQALFEYQSMFTELTGLGVVNCSMYDAASALGEAATLATRVRATTGDRILVPEDMVDGRQSVLENYVSGAGLSIDTFPLHNGTVDLERISERIDADTVMVYLEQPSVRGVIEPAIEEVATRTHEHDAILTLGTDPVALGLLAEPASLGVDVVIGDAATLGLPTSYGMGIGLFATKEDFLRQVPGRLVGAAKDDAGRRTYTLTLQTREQHIRRERATSNICTNQAWVGLRTAMHLAWLGPSGLMQLAIDSIERATTLAEQVDTIDGIEAPIYDADFFREFVARTEKPAADIAQSLESAGFAVHVIDDHLIQICVTETTESEIDAFLGALAEASQ